MNNTRIIKGWALTACLAAAGACAGPEKSAPLGSMDSQVAALAAFELPRAIEDAEGRRQNLADIDGPVVLVFWQTWCAACHKEAPKLVAASEAHPELAFYGVVSGSDADVDDADVRDLAQRLSLPYPNLRDRDLLLTEMFGVKGTPTIVVLNRAREVVYSGHRTPEDWSIAH